MNRRLLDDMKDGEWTEAEIDRRSMQLADYVCKIWPSPKTLAGEFGITLPDSSRTQTTHIQTHLADFNRPLVALLSRKGFPYISPRMGGWMGSNRSFETGHPDSQWHTTLVDGGGAEVFLSLGGPNGQRRFRALHERRNEIASKVSGPIQWRKDRSRIALVRNEACRWRAPEAELEAVRQWMVDSLLALRDALQPHLNRVMRD